MLVKSAAYVPRPGNVSSPLRLVSRRDDHGAWCNGRQRPPPPLHSQQAVRHPLRFRGSRAEGSYIGGVDRTIYRLRTALAGTLAAVAGPVPRQGPSIVRSSRRMILPVEILGRSATNLTDRGSL